MVHVHVVYPLRQFIDQLLSFRSLLRGQRCGQSHAQTTPQRETQISTCTLKYLQYNCQSSKCGITKIVLSLPLLLSQGTRQNQQHCMPCQRASHGYSHSSYDLHVHGCMKWTCTCTHDQPHMAQPHALTCSYYMYVKNRSIIILITLNNPGMQFCKDNTQLATCTCTTINTSHNQIYAYKQNNYDMFCPQQGSEMSTISTLQGIQ